MDAEIIKDTVNANTDQENQDIETHMEDSQEANAEVKEPSFYDDLIEALMDEYSDVDKYYCLAKRTECGGYAQILKDIAKEEWYHAKHLEEILMDACEYKASQELKDLKIKAKAAIDSM